MSVKCREIVDLMEDYASSNLAEDWDNIGLIIGSYDAPIQKVLVALDIDDNVIEEAINKNCSMIITHHPFIFKGLKSITTSETIGKRVIELIKNDICVFSAHTNLDVAKNGTNDIFAKMLNLENIGNLFDKKDSEFGMGRIGTLHKSINFSELAENVKNLLKLDNMVVCGKLETTIKKIAICTGSGGDVDFILRALEKNCDAYITGDIKYHNAQVAKDLGLCLIDATHYASEAIIVPVICEYINNCAKNLNLDLECLASSIDGQTFKII